ncbi:MAG TPA: Gfo/Idh/MocA family oxidoreductase [Bacteroidales bacterium]|nr:Gfo/Idh/MocA family oxidoreductase [Bacteroidales bacterium]HPF03605.1 Gfo/Idh/MocA family oxidoreductase [Bacteroidales bacterium]HPJ59604.1 Gfo/Idh/MocA family oxidoreductase [Bacteroidales bacterium]HPR10918.1 Gfo/Idh/MocA family oxidoreductase [Bacteroidales bacterium]HRW84122.1 Gfo/Idh/MocA family oxidoreductase [Bacteroidales bacterium]
MISWGIIGCGNVTEVKSGPAFNKVKDSRLTAVMRRDAGLAEDYAKRHNVPRFYSDASELINDPGVNAVYVATPPSSHATYALMSIDAGKPVYIEKPMALNYEECLEINEAAERKQVPVFVAYYRRALPGFVMVREMISSGKIGSVRSVHLQLFKAPSPDEISGRLSWRVDPAIAGGGHFFDLASHQLDYLDFLFGPVKEVKSYALNQGAWYKAEDYVSAGFMFDNNVTGTGIWCFNAHQSAGRDSIEIIGDKGYIRFSCFSFDPIIVENEAGKQEYINERPEHVQICLIGQVVEALTKKIPAVSTGITAARTSRVLEEMVKEYYK